MNEIAVVPRIRYPANARVGLTYLMSVDLDHNHPPEAWPYSEEEYPVTCFVDAGLLFEHEPVGGRTIVVHRFGGSYGPAMFRLRAARAASGTMRVILVDRVGVPIAVVELGQIEVHDASTPGFASVEARVADPGHFTGVAAPLDKPLAAAVRKIDGRALLVGTVGNSVDYDIQRMAEMLEARGFVLDVRTGERATREGILAGFDELIEIVRPDQAAVFYYTGRGFYAYVDKESSSWKGIVPIDIDMSTTIDFRGITAWELSIKAAQLTQKTRNATLIFDCCYASQMSPGGATRDADTSAAGPKNAEARALPHPFRLGFAAHLRALEARYGVAFSAAHPLGNPNAVRLVACGSDEVALEYRGDDGQYRGVFTEALLDVLHEVGDARVSWATIDSAIRERVLRRFPVQRPDVEGPAHRLPFSLEELDVSGAVAIMQFSDGLRLLAGHLTGVMPGDIYGVMPPGSPTYRAADAVAELRVRETVATYASVELVAWKNGHSALPPDAIAIVVQKSALRRAVRIDVPASAREAVRTAIAATATLRIAEPDEVTALPTLRLTNDLLTIEDPIGPLFPAARYPEELQRTVADLASLGAAQGLRELEGEHGVSASELEIEWGTVKHGQARPMPAHGSSLALRNKIYVKVRSRSSRTLHVHIFSLGLRGKITLLTAAAPSGVALTSDETELVLGRRDDGALLGLRPSWPAGLPRESPRTDEIVVIVTSTRVSLRGLETTASTGSVRGTSSKLEELFAQLQDGQSRDLRGTDPIDGFFVKRLSYLLHPRDEAMADAMAQVSDDPAPQSAPEADVDADVDDGAARGESIEPHLDFGVVIGIDHYANLPSLRGAVEDAMAFHHWLCDADGGGLDLDNARLIRSDPDTQTPTQFEIDRALLDVLEAAHARGGARRLYFYFSGHGATNLGGPIHDVSLLLPRWSELIARLALRSESYASVLCRAGVFQEVVMFLDCARSASVSVVGAEPLFVTAWEVRHMTRRFMAYAAGAQQPAFEIADSGSWQGAFTRRLLSILGQSPGGVPADMLKARLEREVEAEGTQDGSLVRADVINELAMDSWFGAGRRRAPLLELRFARRRGPVVLRDGLLAIVAEHHADEIPWILELPLGLYRIEGGGEGPTMFNHDGRGEPIVV